MKLQQYFLLAVLPIAALAAESACECPQVKCPGDQPALCTCLNQAAILCYNQCGVPPQIQICPTPSITITTPIATLEARASIICGSRGRPNCPVGTTCINDPASTGCGIESDCPGLCVKFDGPFCGGFAGIQCPQPGQVCVDDPRDDCVPPTGADCGGTCVFLDGSSSGSA